MVQSVCALSVFALYLCLNGAVSVCVCLCALSVHVHGVCVCGLLPHLCFTNPSLVYYLHFSNLNFPNYSFSPFEDLILGISFDCQVEVELHYAITKGINSISSIR